MSLINRFPISPLSGWWTGHDLPPRKVATGVRVSAGLGMTIGILAIWVSPFWALVALVLVGFGILALQRAEYTLMGILIATSSVIYEESLPMISTPIGSLHIADVLLLASLGLIIIRRLVQPDFEIVRTPLDLPLLSFYAVALFSTFVALVGSSVQIEEPRRAIRVVTYYLTFFVVTNLIREERQLRLLIRGIFLLATIVAAGMIAQFIVGESIPFLPGRVRILITGNQIYSGMTRSFPPGHSVLLVSLIAGTVMLCFEDVRRTRVLGLLKCALLGTGLVLTFLRSYWAAIGVAVSLLAFLSRRQERRRLISLSLMGLFLLTVVSVVAFVEPDSKLARLAAASLARGATLVTSQTIEEDSLEWRYIENSYAVQQIISHPLIGLGLGARYRPFDPRLDRAIDFSKWDARRFIHNGHLAVLLGTGLLGYLCLVWLSLAFLIRSFRYWRLISDSRMRGIVLGFTLAFLGVLIAAFVNSSFVSWSWVPVIGIMMGVNEVVLRKSLQKD